jgi:hypothetical protein
MVYCYFIRDKIKGKNHKNLQTSTKIKKSDAKPSKNILWYH